MTDRDRFFPEIPSSSALDAAIDRALRGEAVGDDFTPLGQFVDDIRVMLGSPPPQPPAELAELLAGGIADKPASATRAFPEPGARRAGQPRRSRRSAKRSHATPSRLRIAALGVAGKAALGLAFTTAVAAGGAAGILPAPVGDLVRRAIEAVTPFDLPDQGAVRHTPSDHRGGDTDDDRSGYEPNDAAVASPGSQSGVTGGEPGPGEMLSSDDGLGTGADTAPDEYPAVDPPIDADAGGWAPSSPGSTAPTAAAGSTPPPASDSGTWASQNDGSATNGRPPGEHTPPGGPPPGQPKPSEPPAGQAHSGGPPPGQPKPSEPPAGQAHSGGPPPGQPKPNEPPAGQPKPSDAPPGQPEPNDPAAGQSRSDGPLSGGRSH